MGSGGRDVASDVEFLPSESSESENPEVIEVLRAVLIAVRV
jgi:hypothetical protein